MRRCVYFYAWFLPVAIHVVIFKINAWILRPACDESEFRTVNLNECIIHADCFVNYASTCAHWLCVCSWPQG